MPERRTGRRLGDVLDGVVENDRRTQRRSSLARTDAASPMPIWLISLSASTRCVALGQRASVSSTLSRQFTATTRWQLTKRIAASVIAAPV